MTKDPLLVIKTIYWNTVGTQSHNPENSLGPPGELICMKLVWFITSEAEIGLCDKFCRFNHV